MKGLKLLFLCVVGILGPSLFAAACFPPTPPPCDATRLPLDCYQNAVKKCRGDKVCLDREIAACSLEVARECLLQGSAGSGGGSDA